MKTAQLIKQQIVFWLLKGNLSFDIHKHLVGTEVLFSTNQRRADLLILNGECHAMEIKSDRDSLAKLSEQLEDYHKTFDCVSVVTTKSHLSKVKTLARPATGIIVVEDDVITVLKQAKTRKRLDKLSLSMFLHKPELAKLLSVRANDYYTGQLRQMLIQKLSVSEIRAAAYECLKKQYKEQFVLFVADQLDKLSPLASRELFAGHGHIG